MNLDEIPALKMSGREILQILLLKVPGGSP